MRNPRRALLGNLLVREGLVTEGQLEEALRTQAEVDTFTPIGQILVGQGIITQAQLNVVLEKYHKKYRLGDVLVETNIITDAQLHLALDHQKKTGLRLGEVLLQLDLVTEEQMKRALCQQFAVTFVDLDTVVLDRSLVRLLNKSYAQHRRVIPIAKVGDRITLAMDDPTDVELIHELTSFTGLKVDVVTSTYAAFQRALARAYEDGPAAPPPEPLEEAPAGAHDTSTEESGDSRALAELEAAYQALQHEHAVTVEAFQELTEWHARTLAELEAAHEALREAREASARAERGSETRQAGTSRALAELETSHQTLCREYEVTAQVLQHERAQYLALLKDREETADRLEAILRRLKP